MKKLNSTGSFYLDEFNNYWSYNTQLTCDFRNYRLVNRTYYSQTTRKHQSQIIPQSNDISIINGHKGRIVPGDDLVFYLRNLCHQLNEFKLARNSKHKEAKINDCQNKIDLISKVINEEVRI